MDAEKEPASIGAADGQPAMFTWVMREDFLTTEEHITGVFGQWVGVVPEAVEFTDMAGERQTVVVFPPQNRLPNLPA